MSKKYSYKTYPPYVDAYECSWGDERLKTLKEAKDLAISHAVMWGEQSIGRAVLKTGSPAKYKGDVVVGCLSLWDEGDYRKSFLVVIDKNIDSEYWFDQLKVVEGPIEYDWNVT